MFPALYLHYAEHYRPDCRVYGHLPTLVRLRSDLGLKTTPGYNKFPDLLRYAVGQNPQQIVCAREPMQIVNDFGVLIPSLYPDGLVYYPDSNAKTMPQTMYLDWRRAPKLYDQKESVLYVVYYLLNGESLNQAGDSEGKRLWAKAVEVVRAQENFALSNELAAYFIRVGELRLARTTLEQGQTIPGLRFGQRLRLLSSLGSVAFEAGDEKRSSEIFTQVMLMEPSNALAKYHLLALDAQAAAQSGRTQEAIDTYRRMLGLFPDQREVNLRLGELLLKTGDTTAAKAMLEICLRCNYRVDYVQQLLGSK
jgi:tetratricopeptide (TPR) repeat protein